MRNGKRKVRRGREEYMKLSKVKRREEEEGGTFGIKERQKVGKKGRRSICRVEEK